MDTWVGFLLGPIQSAWLCDTLPRMTPMKLDQKHRDVAGLLAELRFSGLTQDELAKRCGVGRKTLYNWRQDDDFLALYHGLVRVKISNIEDSPFAQRVDRINEMFRIYVKVGETKTSDLRTKIDILGKIATEAEEGKVDEAAGLVVRLRQELANLQGESRLHVHDE
jgi:transcriptional regulator with XRE-family HTH domain